MYDEICEQPAALTRTLKSELRAAERLKRLVAANPPRFIVLVARGTSDNAAQFARYLIEICTGIPVSLAAPSIFTLYQANVDYRGALVVAISQSGESTDINVVLERARAQGALTIGITNEPRSSMVPLAAHVFLVRAGKEKSVAATKTYTGQMMALYLIAYALGARIRIADLERIPAWTEAALGLAPAIEALAQRYRFMEQAVVVGRGLNYANAFEFALKMMETCYVVAERFSSADFLHGPIALVEKGFPLFLFAPSGVTWPSMKEMLEKLRHLKAETLIVTDRQNMEAPADAGRAIVIPARIPELFTPIPYIIPAQLFAAALAREKGLDPDRPRTLSKVTQTL
ncbi:MAG: Glutamine--fructose-6-phosphate transaminase (isomerizing) [Bryobacterales bacterium]|nr:Glutamine--fructose-6-phosphate transaminase (isomerizing) [Bryobacterales bacterium]